MAWIESHQQLKEHPKVFDLMSFMGWDLDQTIGKLHRFWWWCVDYAEDGDLRKHSDDRLARAVGLNGELAKHFIESMVKSCWIDREPYFRVHDWWDYIGMFLQIKYKSNSEKWIGIRCKYKNNGSNNGCNNGSENSIPNLTKPNHIKKKKLNDDEFILSLKANKAYSGLDVDKELAKMDSWLSVNKGRQKTRKFIVGWLNRNADRTTVMAVSAPNPNRKLKGVPSV